jgi:hypothetical protein
MTFEYPRDPKSSLGLIELDVMKAAASELTKGMTGRFQENKDFQIFANGEIGYNVPNVLLLAAACAFLKDVDPEEDYHAAVIKQSLLDYGVAATTPICESSSKESLDRIRHMRGFLNLIRSKMRFRL